MKGSVESVYLFLDLNTITQVIPGAGGTNLQREDGIPQEIWSPGSNFLGNSVPRTEFPGHTQTGNLIPGIKCSRIKCPVTRLDPIAVTNASVW